MKTLSSLLLVCIAFAVSGQAQQQGSIITDSDTLNVYILTRHAHTNQFQVSYRKYVNSKDIVVLPASEIKSFYYDKNFAVSKTLPNSNTSVLLKRMLTGYVSVLKGIDAKGYPTFYFEKEGVLQKLEAEAIGEQVQNYFSDCKTFAPKKPISYEAYSLMDATSQYNACVKSDQYVYVKYKRPIVFSGGAKFGANLQTLDYRGESASGPGLDVGFFWDVTYNDIVSLQIEANFITRGGETDHFKIKSNYFQLPLLLEIHVPVSRNAVYFQAGPSLNVGLGNKIQQSVVDQTFLPYTQTGGAMGMILGVGVKIPRAFRKSSHFEVRYNAIKQKTTFATQDDEIINNRAIQFVFSTHL